MSVKAKIAKPQTKKPQPEKVEKKVAADTAEKCTKDSAKVDDILCFYHTTPLQDLRQNTLELLDLLSTQYEELEKRGDKLLDRLVAATTVSDEVKNVMLQESENILRAKSRIVNVKTVILTRLCSSYIEEETDMQDIRHLFTDSTEESTEPTTPQI
jgi:hypothetical protein